MNTLKEQDGRYYQECEVVMIVTKDKPFQHIYILSNENIKEGDWYMVTDFTKPEDIRQATKYLTPEERRHNGYKKIIATTDGSLGNMILYLKVGKAMKGNWKSLPKPSDSFIKKYIEEYNKGNVITKVLVEYVDNGEEDWIGDDYNGEPFWNTELEIKVDSSNQITIKKVKDTWSIGDLTGNGTESLDQFLLNSPDFTQEEREIIIDAVSQYINKS